MSCPTLEEWKQLQCDVICKECLDRFRKENKASARTKASDQLDYEDQYSELKVSRTRKPHTWITINPKPGVFIDEIELILLPALDKYFDWCVYAYEIRKLPDEGLHCHLLGKIKDQYCNRNFSRFKEPFLQICGNLKHIDIKYPSDEDLKDCFSYLNKTKVSRSKKSANEATQTWREENGIIPYYTYGDLPTCLVPDSQELINLS